MNIIELMDRAARTKPESPAIIDGPYGRERAETFAALDNQSRRIAALFARQGLRAGDGIVTFVPMSAELFQVIAAALRLGLVPVFIDPAAGNDHFNECLGRYPIRAFVGSWKACLLRLGSPALRNIPLVFVAGVSFPGACSLHDARRLPPYPDTYAADAGAPAMLAFTSGSTGTPKGMLRSHGLLLDMYQTLARHLNPAAGEVDLATMPFVTFTNLASAVTSVIPDADLRRPGEINPRRLAGQMVRWRASSIVASPALLERVADDCLSRGASLPLLGKVFVGGAPVFPRLIDKLHRVAPGAHVIVLYGSSEAEPIAKIIHREMADKDLEQTLAGKGLLVGLPVAETELRILRDRWGEARGPYTAQEFARETLPNDAVGEIVVAGAHVSPGYLAGHGDKETKIKVDGKLWHRTGDAGCLDDQGRLWLAGRCSARIHDPAGAIYPFAVEAALSARPEIARSAFLEYHDRRWLVLQLRRPWKLDRQAMLQLVPWAKLDNLVLVRRLPVDRRHNAKIDYPALRQLLAEQKWLTRLALSPS